MDYDLFLKKEKKSGTFCLNGPKAFWFPAVIFWRPRRVCFKSWNVTAWKCTICDGKRIWKGGGEIGFEVSHVLGWFSHILSFWITRNWVFKRNPSHKQMYCGDSLLAVCSQCVVMLSVHTPISENTALFHLAKDASFVLLQFSLVAADSLITSSFQFPF